MVSVEENGIEEGMEDCGFCVVAVSEFGDRVVVVELVIAVHEGR